MFVGSVTPNPNAGVVHPSTLTDDERKWGPVILELQEPRIGRSLASSSSLREQRGGPITEGGPVTKASSARRRRITQSKQWSLAERVAIYIMKEKRLLPQYRTEGACDKEHVRMKNFNDLDLNVPISLSANNSLGRKALFRIGSPEEIERFANDLFESGQFSDTSGLQDQIFQRRLLLEQIVLVVTKALIINKKNADRPHFIIPLNLEEQLKDIAIDFDTIQGEVERVCQHVHGAVTQI